MSWFRFQGKESSTMGVILLERTCELYGKTRGQFLSIPGRDGALYLPQAREDIAMTLRCAVLSDDEADLQLAARELAGWLYGSGELVFWDAPDLTRQAYVLSVPGFEGFERWGEFQVSLRCSPYALGNEITANANETVIYEGSAPSRGQIRFSLAQTHAKIVAACGSQELTLQGDLNQGDAFVIDLDGGLVWCNGQVRNDMLTVGSRFFEVPAGTGCVQLMGQTDGVSTPLEGCYHYRPRWY